MVSSDEKAYIIERMLSVNPANGMSAEQFRKQVGVVKTPTYQNLLKYKMKSMIGGLSEDEAKRIMMASPFNQVEPSGLELGNKVIDLSNANAMVGEVVDKKNKNKVCSSSQGTYIPEFPVIPSRKVEKEITLEDLEDFSKGDAEGLEIIGSGTSRKPRKKNRLSDDERKKRAERGTASITQWQQFYAKTSVWPVFANMKGCKRKAVSILYKAAKEKGIEKIKTVKKLHFDAFEDYVKFMVHEL